MGWQEKQNYNRSRVKYPFGPFDNFCTFLKGESLDAILEERTYLHKRVDGLESAMYFSNFQIRKLQAQVKNLEDEKAHLKTGLSDVLQAPFAKYKKNDSAESPARRGAPVGHEGHFRPKTDAINKTIDVYLDQCPLCESKNISPCNHTTEHSQEDFEYGNLTATCFVYCYYWCLDCKNVVPGWSKNEIPNVFIGPNARAKASFLRHEIKSSCNDVRRTVECRGK